MILDRNAGPKDPGRGPALRTRCVRFRRPGLAFQVPAPTLEVLAASGSGVQPRQRPGPCTTVLVHENRRLDVPSRTLEQPGGATPIESCDRTDDATGTIAQLVRSGPDIHHQITERLARTDHGSCRQHVE